MKKIKITAFITVIILNIFFLIVPSILSLSSIHILHVSSQGGEEYITIQDAIDNATNGTIIYVCNGTYFENIIINKKLTLTGENKVTTIIDGNISGNVITITSDFVSINNFTIENGTFGIFIDNASDNTIKENNISNNSNTGIYVSPFSKNNTIYHNNFINNTQNAYDESVNYWDFENEGNYWSDYKGTDDDYDNIGDTSYNITGGENKDHYPLMEPYTEEKYDFVVDEDSLYFMLLISMIVAIVFLLPIAYIWFKKQKR